VAAPTTIIFCIYEGYKFILSLHNLPQVAHYFPSFLPHFWLTCHCLFLYLFRIFLFLSLLFLCPYLSLSSFHLSSPSLCFFFVVFLSLAPRIKFLFLRCSSFLSVICLHLFFFLLISSSFHVSFLVSCSVFFPACFYSLFLSSHSNFTFSPSLLHCSLPTNQCFLLSSFLIFSYNLFPLMIRKTPKLTPCTRYDVTSAHLLCRPSGVN